jgi:hypothetical protein
MTQPIERCIACDEPTGRAGAGEDSLYTTKNDLGPFCGTCYPVAEKEEERLMPNRHPKCDICLLRHRPGKCKGRVAPAPFLALNGIDWQSSPILAEQVASLYEEMAREILAKVANR